VTPAGPIWDTVFATCVAARPLARQSAGKCKPTPYAVTQAPTWTFGSTLYRRVSCWSLGLQVVPSASILARAAHTHVRRPWPSVDSRDATTSVFHQRDAGRVLRSSRRDRGRGLASSRRREHRSGRCPSLRPRDLPNDGGSVAAVDTDGDDARMDGALRSNNRRGEEIRRIAHARPRGLERGARARRSREGGAAAEAAAGQGNLHRWP
jgi:hypothetical protein